MQQRTRPSFQPRRLGAPRLRDRGRSPSRRTPARHGAACRRTRSISAQLSGPIHPHSWYIEQLFDTAQLFSTSSPAKHVLNRLGLHCFRWVRRTLIPRVKTTVGTCHGTTDGSGFLRVPRSGPGPGDRQLPSSAVPPQLRPAQNGSPQNQSIPRCTQVLATGSSLSGSSTACDGGASPARRRSQLFRAIALALEHPLDPGHPLWECWIIEGLNGNRWAILINPPLHGRRMSAAPPVARLCDVPDGSAFANNVDIKQIPPYGDAQAGPKRCGECPSASNRLRPRHAPSTGRQCHQPAGHHQ